MHRTLIFILSLSLLSGCTAMLTGAGGTSAGRPIGSDSRPASRSTEDAKISVVIRNRLSIDPDLSATRLTVVTNRGVVTLRGTVSAFDHRDHAVNLASDVPGVVRVVNQITVRP